MSDANSKALALVPRSIDEVTSLAERLAKSTLLPSAMRGKEADVLFTIMAGQELGFAPMASIRAFHTIEGKPSMAAEAMVALVLASGKAKYFRRVGEGTAESVTYETWRVGDPEPRRCTWTIAMARTAGLHTKDNWRTYPRPQLSARAKSELAKDVYPDVLAGIYSTEEVLDWSGDVPSALPAAPAAQRNADAVDAEVVSESIEHPAFKLIDAAPTVDALKALGKSELTQLKGAQRAEAKRRYDARMAVLEKAKCDGEHGEPRCADPECWNGNAPQEEVAS